MMEIRLRSKKLGTSPQTHTQVVFVEKGVERFVRRGTGMTLEIVSGKHSKVTRRTFRTLIRGVVLAAKKYKINKLLLDINANEFSKLAPLGVEWMYQTLAENALLADYEFTTYKSKQQQRFPKEVALRGEAGKAIRDAVQRGTLVASCVNMSRDISNTPGGDLTPRHLAEQAKLAFKGTKAKVTVLDTAAIKKLKMGGLLGVGGGAKEKPCFIVIEYLGAGGNEPKPIVFVGKGITFDTGGLQIKPGMSMYEMHLDMSGGAAVIGAIAAIAKLGLHKNVVGLIPAAENAVSDEAIRPGDVLTMMSGKTVDVLHTDAEGRLILADALHYARKYNPRLVVDVATLTGAALVAVGQHANVIMTKDRTLEDSLRELGELSGDYVFPLPLWDEFKQYTKGVHADITNIPQGDTRFGGTINGGMFLSHFAKGMKWVHIDMAPRMTSVPSDKLAKGATGEPVRLLIKIAETF